MKIITVVLTEREGTASCVSLDAFHLDSDIISQAMFFLHIRGSPWHLEQIQPRPRLFVPPNSLTT
jgi:hypothetical protein